jgi:putative membrane protein
MLEPETRCSAAPQDVDSILMESHRTLLLIINTSLTLIGFGFTINELFGNAAGRTVISHPDLVGRILGLSLLSGGLLLLALGIREHAALVKQLTGQSVPILGNLRRDAARRHTYSSIFTVAVLLLAIGLFTLGAVIFGIIYGRLVEGRA